MFYHVLLLLSIEDGISSNMKEAVIETCAQESQLSSITLRNLRRQEEQLASRHY